MDPLTQASLGGAIGAAFFGRSLGRRAVLFGALAGMSPDLDVLAGLWSDEWDTLAAHRGSSHSLLVLPLVALPMGYLGYRAFGESRRLWSWIHLALWALCTHPMLDAFTTYGTQLLAPFSRERFVFDAVAIIDPFFTLPLFTVLIVAYTRWGTPDRSALLGRLALSWAVLYLAVGLGLTRQAESAARAQLAAEGFVVQNLRGATPFFFPAVRRISAHDGDGRIRIGFRSSIRPRPIRWTEFQSEDGPRIRAAVEHRGAQTFHWFAADFVQAIRQGDDVMFADRRYGLMSVPDFTPFHAQATFDPSGKVVDVRQSRVFDRSSLNLGRELSLGWCLMWASCDET